LGDLPVNACSPAIWMNISRARGTIMVKHIHNFGWDQSGVELQILDGTETLRLMSKRGRSKGRCHLQIVLVDVPLTSVPTRNVRVGICSQSESKLPLPFLFGR
jgi:hypothetical protein